MNRNLDNFLNLFPDNNMPDIFVLSETWHNKKIPINIPGYVGFHTVREGRAGGVTVLAKYHLNVVEHIDQISFANESIEICSIKITNSSCVIYVCGVYRPQSSCIENFSFQLETILNENYLIL